jgi:hypothetical protein
VSEKNRAGGKDQEQTQQQAETTLSRRRKAANVDRECTHREPYCVCKALLGILPPQSNN